MPLLSLWQANPQAVRQLNIEQLVGTAGDGRLRDGSECQQELQEYLRQASVEALAKYADYCLTSSFNKSGQVLQDIINELGRRLEYEVINGRYQGTSSAIGFDGIWRDPTGHGIVVEVKTTDAYRLALDTVAGYRDRLIEQGELSSPCSILIVVGRVDTGELEAQVRGSQHAWHIRLISVESLLNLVRVKESADSQETIAKVRKILTPIEYTRLDDLVDVMFTATQDVETAVASETGEPEDSETDATKEKGTWEFTPSDILQAKRESIVESLGNQVGVHFVKKTRAMYWDPDRKHRLVCTVSKLYTSAGSTRYWYAYHPSWDEFLAEGEKGYLALGCMDLDIAFAIPLDIVRAHLKELHTTEKREGGGHYWHMKISETQPKCYALQLPQSTTDLALDDYSIHLESILIEVRR